MLKQYNFLIFFLLALVRVGYTQEIQVNQLSKETKQSLEARGFEVLGIHKSISPPSRDKEKKEEDKSEYIQIKVKLDLRRSNIQTMYMGSTSKFGTSEIASNDTILVDGFENEFPGTTWQLSGNPTWGKAAGGYSGKSSVWCAAGGDSAVTPGNPYPPNLQSMMVFGPFDLSDANYGQLNFRYWMNTELQKDWFYYMVSTDGNSFSGIGITGSTTQYAYPWFSEELPLSSVPGLGDVTGQSQVWIAFLFESGTIATKNKKGVYIDDVTLFKKQIIGTPVAGAVSGVWSPENNPYIAQLTIGVAAGDTLKILPGVEIRFEANYEFVILGSLWAVGTSSDSIIFTSGKSIPMPGDWTGIGFYSQNRSILQYVKIEYGGGGNSHFNGGIYSKNHVLQIKSNRIASNNGAGVFCASNSLIEENYITDNEIGIEVAEGAPQILKNIIQKNGRGISNAATTLLFSLIKENQIFNNSGSGIFYSNGRLQIVNNLIKNNGSDGIIKEASGIFMTGTAFILGNKIIDNTNHGINLRGYTIEEGAIIQNLIKGNKDGVHIDPALFRNEHEIKIINNTIVSNTEYGIYFYNGDLSKIFIQNNIIALNSKTGIFSNNVNTTVNILFNNITGNSPDYEVRSQESFGFPVLINANGDSCDIHFNINEEPLFSDPDSEDYHLQYVENGFPVNSPCRDAGNPNIFYNDMDGTINDMGVFGGSGVYINPTSNDFEKLIINMTRSVSLQISNYSNIDFTINNLQISDPVNFSFKAIVPIVISPYQSVIINVTFKPQNSGSHSSVLSIFSDDFNGSTLVEIFLSGEAVNGTIVNTGTVSGTWTRAGSPYLVTGGGGYTVTVAPNTNLTIEPGVHVLFESCRLLINGKFHAAGTKEDSIIFTRAYKHTSWGGLWFSFADPASKLEYCIIENAQGIGTGGGIRLYNSNITIKNSTIQRNTNVQDFGGAGGIHCEESSPIIVNNTIRNNFSVDVGGGIYAKGNSSPVISNNFIYKNWAGSYGGGGIYLWDSCFVSNNVVIQNEAESSGGGLSSHRHSRLVNNIFAKNRARIGGGIYGWVVVENNVIFDNYAQDEGGGLYNIHNLSNSIVYSNHANQNPQIYATKSSKVAYSDIQGGWQGKAIIDVEPLFVDPQNSDFHLKSNSPCIDKGDPDPYYNDPEDPLNPGFALFPSLQTIINDMGAYGGPGTIFKPNIILSVDSLVFDTTFVGNTSLKEFAIMNHGTEKLIVTDIVSSDNSFTMDLTSLTVSPLSSQKVNVSFSPSTSGSHKGVVNILSNDSARTSVDVFLIGEGRLAPIILVSLIDDVTIDEDMPKFTHARLDTIFSATDNQALSFISTISDSGIIVSITEDTLEITAVQDAFGEFTVILKADDGLYSVKDTFVVTVNPINDEPVVSNIPPIIFLEDSSYSFDLDHFVSDVDHDTTEISWFANFPNSILASIIRQVNNINTLDKNQNKFDLKMSLAEDSEVNKKESKPAGLKIVYQKKIIVDPNNKINSLSQNSSTTEKNSEIKPIISPISVCGIIHGNQDSLMISIDSLTHIATITVTPNFYGLDIPIIFTAMDDSGGSDSDTTIISVQPINDPPIISNLPDSMVFTADSSAKLNIWDYVKDIETPDSSLLYLFTTTNDSLIYNFDTLTGILILFTKSGFSGEAFLNISVADDSNAVAKDSIYVIVSPNTGIQELLTCIPKEFILMQNYPNPFNPITHIRFGLPKTEDVKIIIYNVRGEQVVILVDGPMLAGYHVLDFDATQFGSGLYFYHIKAGEFQAVKKMILLK